MEMGGGGEKARRNHPVSHSRSLYRRSYLSVGIHLQILPSKFLARTDPEISRLLLCVMPNFGFSSFRSDYSGSRKSSLPRRVLSIGAISLAGGLVLSAVNDLAIFNGCTTSASFLLSFGFVSPNKINPAQSTIVFLMFYAPRLLERIELHASK